MNKKKLAGRALLLTAVLALAGWPGSPFPKNCAGAEHQLGKAVHGSILPRKNRPWRSIPLPLRTCAAG